MVVDHAHLMRRSGGPLPEYDIDIIQGRSGCETRYDDGGDTLGGKILRQRPTRWPDALIGQSLPGAGQVARPEALHGEHGWVGQVHDIRAINVVCAEGHWLGFERE